jgi:hypothetical protein
MKLTNLFGLTLLAVALGVRESKLLGPRSLVAELRG